MSTQRQPLVSIVIVNWNGKKYLEKCLLSLKKITYKNIEIIVVDQNSSDGSKDTVKKKFSEVYLISNLQNTGYVGGNNLGASKAKGKYLLILNNDIEVAKNFLEPLVNAFEKDKKLGCAQPKAINLRKKGSLDGGGSFLTWTGFLYHKGYLDRSNKPDYNVSYPVYSVKGAYLITRRRLFVKLGGLDPDFFIYFEETDYCGRVWLAGYKVLYIPESVVYHWGGTDTKKDWQKRYSLVQYRTHKNRICSYLKNISLEKLSIMLPIHLAMIEGGAIYYLFSRKAGTAVSIQKAIIWNFINIKSTLRKRKKIQNTVRKVSDKEIFKVCMKNMGLNYYLDQVSIVTGNRIK